ncbi:hypothetical protein ACF8MH_04280 [Pseudomonas sp. YQ_13]|uniref:hypothetical protein n=1 Tax=Pseudomonas sp. YQ_13 TaxID=3367235 RepID=UPI00370AC6AC
MAISHRDLIAIAQHLLAEGSETALRSSMSRAYYGLFHVATEYAELVGVPPPSALVGTTHSKLGVFYQANKTGDKAFQMKMKQVGWALRSLHELRCKADYHLADDISKHDAEDCLARCIVKIDLVEELLRDRAA